MKHRMFAPAVLALALAAALAACTKPAPAPAEPSTPPPVAADTRQPTLTPAPVPTPTPTPVPVEAPAWGNQVFSRAFTATDGTTVLSVQYTMPLVQNTDTCPAGVAINQWYKDEGALRMSEAEEEYEMAVADYDVSTAAGFSFVAPSREMTYQVVYEDSAAISVRRELYVDYGGAHPWVYRLSEQFDARTGLQLNFSDFFSDADAVLERVQAAFLACPELSGAIAAGTLSADQVAVAYQPENFYLTEDGFVFWIQGNTLPAQNSPIEVTVPYNQLEDVTIYG